MLDYTAEHTACFGSCAVVAHQQHTTLNFFLKNIDMARSCRLKCFVFIFKQNQDRKHRTYVYVLTVTEILEDWEDSVNIGKFLFLLLSEFS